MNTLRISDLEHLSDDATEVKGGQPFRLDLELGTVVRTDLVVDINVASTPAKSNFNIGLASGVASGVAASLGDTSILTFNVGAKVN